MTLSRGGSRVLLAALLTVPLSGCSVFQDGCDEQRAAEADLRHLERSAAPGADELMNAYNDLARNTDACTASLARD